MYLSQKGVQVGDTPMKKRSSGLGHSGDSRVIGPLLQWLLQCVLVGVSMQSPVDRVAADMQAWGTDDCGERRLPSWSHLGACAAPRSLVPLYESRDGTSHPGADADCAAAFDGNVSTFVEDVVILSERTVFDRPQPAAPGSPDGRYVGINLHGHLVHLSGVSVTPRAPKTDWQPRVHPYSPALQTTNWTTTIAGARVQGSRDLVSWTDLYTFTGVLAPYPAATVFNFEAMTNGSCMPYSAFRLAQPTLHKRVYFANSALGPVEISEEYAVASMAELSFLGVRSLGSQPDATSPFINYTCVAALKASSVRLSPPARRYPSAVNMSLVGPLHKCGAQVWYTLDGSEPRKGWSGGGVEGVIGNAPVGGGKLDKDTEVRIISAGAPGTVTQVQVRVFQHVESSGAVFSSLQTSESYTFPQSRLVPLCPVGTVAFPGDGMWCYKHYNLSQAKSFWDAESACQRDGGHLASAFTAQENAFLARLARKPGTGDAGAEGGNGEESIAWIGFYRPMNDSRFRWTDESEVGWQSWVEGLPLHGTGTANPANGTCAYIGAGDWWKSECSYTSGKLCGGRAWGPWAGRWGDVVAMAEADAARCFGQPTTSMVPAEEGCFQEHWVGTDLDDPCRQKLPYICKTTPQLVCAAGYYSPTGTHSQNSSCHEKTSTQDAKKPYT